MRLILFILLLTGYCVLPTQADAAVLLPKKIFQFDNSKKPKGSSEDLKKKGTTWNLILFQQRNNYTFPRTNGLSQSNITSKEFPKLSSENIDQKINNPFPYWKKIRLRLIFPKHYFF